MADALRQLRSQQDLNLRWVILGASLPGAFAPNDVGVAIELPVDSLERSHTHKRKGCRIGDITFLKHIHPDRQAVTSFLEMHAVHV